MIMMMINLLIISLFFFLCFNCELHNQSLHHHNNSIDYHLLWTIWKLRYHQYYRNQIDEINSFIVWKINIDQILLHNLYYDLQLKTYRKSINQYTVINWDDFYQNKKNQLNLLHHQKNRLLLVKEKYRSYNVTNSNNNHHHLPDIIDWRDNDTVTPVKTQEDCASSWAIASVEALEGQVKRKTGILTPLSSQQLIDCTGDHECVENPVTVAFDFIKQYGVESQEDYPFTGKVGNCTYSSSKSVTTLSSYIQVDDNEEELQKAVYDIGPIAVRITMTQEFLTYGFQLLTNPLGSWMRTVEESHTKTKQLSSAPRFAIGIVYLKSFKFLNILVNKIFLWLLQNI
ncbi:unnamed protein product [Schistosoma margrebowiei]|uniref:Peptidase C1A papain C-terminal domain-containing protein n=1 Tax=Schistosoma margrebowiei TaxID=48269 RepID=A0AA84ZSA3_9TREM|nr:unnamed protein product [Schistosoma margrebowiei]